jgi:F0F1-type ATP synthase assembly protein I
MPDQSPRKRRTDNLLNQIVPSGFWGQLVMAAQLPVVLVGSVLIGGGIGWLLDRWLHSAPWLLLLFGLLGFASGMRELLRRISASGNGSTENKNDDR